MLKIAVVLQSVCAGINVMQSVRYFAEGKIGFGFFFLAAAFFWVWMSLLNAERLEHP